jgi:2-methylcitrate dehydratase PrpD
MSTSPISLTRALAEFAAAPVFPAGGAAACEIAKTGLLDVVATALAGGGEPVVQIVTAQAHARGGIPEVPLLFSGKKLPAGDAALVNAVAGHALDYDDVSLSAHTSVVLVPALLADGYRRGASGRDVLRAYVVGYEVWADLFSREPDPLHVKGWHPTSVFGTVAGAAAIGCLRRLPVDTIQRAIAIAASLSSGLVANFGTMTKPLHAGRAAAAAIEAVDLAERGLTATADALEHHAGFLAALSPAGRVDLTRPFALNPAGPRLLTIGLSLKRYPVCYSCHRVIDGMITLADESALSPVDVQTIDVTIGAAQASMLRNHRPKTALEAKFSIEFAAAAALVARRVGLSELTDAFVNRADIQTLCEQVRIEVADTRCPIDPTFGFADRVQVIRADGSRLDSGDIRFARGNAKNPVQAVELQQKFIDCVDFGNSQQDGSALYAKLARLETVSDLRSVLE